MNDWLGRMAVAIMLLPAAMQMLMVGGFVVAALATARTRGDRT